MTCFVSGNSGSFAGITKSFSFNKRLQPINMSASAPSQTVFSIGYDFHFGNGDSGNVVGITNYRDNSRNQSFTYDSLNRLTSATVEKLNDAIVEAAVDDRLEDGSKFRPPDLLEIGMSQS